MPTTSHIVRERPQLAQRTELLALLLAFCSWVKEFGRLSTRRGAKSSLIVDRGKTD